jgi:hypothetical protein
MPEEQIKGRARIYLSDELVQHASVKIEKPKGGQIYWGEMEVKELFDLFASFLLLPASYSILGVYFEAVMYQWVIIVESADIPLPEANMLLPTLMAVYEVTADGKPRLSDFHVWR